MSTTPRTIGPLVPIVAVAFVVVAAVVYDSWPASDAVDPSPADYTASQAFTVKRRFLPPQPPVVPGHPGMTHEAIDASFELQLAYLRDVLGREIATPRTNEREDWYRAVVAEYPNLSPATRSELAESPNTLLRFRHSWAQLKPDEQARIREEARASGAARGLDPIAARYLADGLRAQMYRSSIRGWSGFLVNLRAVPISADAPIATPHVHHQTRALEVHIDIDALPIQSDVKAG